MNLRDDTRVRLDREATRRSITRDTRREAERREQRDRARRRGKAAAQAGRRWARVGEPGQQESGQQRDAGEAWGTPPGGA
jgi:hypothetical protein